MSGIQQGLMASYPAPVSVTYATWDPANKDASYTLSGGNLTTTKGSNGWNSVNATMAKSSGKWYWEFKRTSGTIDTFVGIAFSTYNPSTASYVGGSANTYGYYSNGGQFYENNSARWTGATWTTGDVIGFALDMDNGTIKVYKNNVQQGSTVTGLTGSFLPCLSHYYSGGVGVANFGATTMAYTAPSGYNQGLYN